MLHPNSVEKVLPSAIPRENRPTCPDDVESEMA